MSKQVNYNENLVAGAAIRDDKGRRISKLFESPHPKMTVGYAKNLIMPNDPTEQEFNFRQSGGGLIEDGVAVIDKVKGNSVVWNQLLRNGNFADGTSGWSKDSSATWSISAGVIHIHKDGGEAGSTTRLWRHDSIPCVIGHKYLYLATVKTTSGKLSIVPTGTASEGQSAYSEYLTTTRLNYIWTANALSANFELRGYDNKIANTDLDFYASNINVFDLTLMFGAGNEPTTYEEFLQRKPKVADEYAYNEGTIVDNKVEKVKVTGINLWDEQWELGTIGWSGVEVDSNTRIRSSFVPIFANTTYYFKCGRVRYEVFFYDANKSPISHLPLSLANGTLTTPNGAVYLRFTTNSSYTETTYNHDICINLSDPTINGKYFPYEKHELDLSWVKDIKDAEGVKLFEDGMKSAGTAFDEVAKGRAIKRIRKYVFDGSEPISEIELNDDGTAFKVSYFAFFETTSTGTQNAVSIGAGFYSQYDGGYHFDLWAAGFAAVRSYIICVPSSVAKTSDEIKEYLKQKYNEGNPLVVYYELAEPIEVEYDEKNLSYPVVAGGTEEAIASEPSSAFRADVGYGIDAVKTILDLKARVEALEAK